MKRIISKSIVILGIFLSLDAHGQNTIENGIKMYWYKRYQTAEKILEPLAADPRANYYLGLCYLETGNTDKATVFFAKFPEDPANISGTARIAFFQKATGKGMQIAKDLAAKSRKKEWIQEKLAADAITYTDGGDVQQAISWYKEALTRSDDPEIHIGLGDALRKLPGGAGDAMNNYEHVTDKNNKNSLAFTRIGDTWYEGRVYQSAVENYNKAIQADPENPLPYKSLADAYYRSGSYQKALENMKKYMGMSDNSLADQLENDELLYNAKSYCDAATQAKMLLPKVTDPTKKTELYGILGFSQAECGDSVAAVSTLHTYFQMQSPSRITPGAYIQFGKLFMKLNMLDSAGYYYTKGVAGDTASNRTDVYRDLAVAYKSQKDFCKAAVWYNNIVKANPGTEALDYFWRGYMYFYCNDYNSALTAFQDFENKYPDQPSAIYWHGRVAAAIDSNATEGTAENDFKNWLAKVGPDYNKKNDLKIAYQYLLFYYFNKKDKENIAVYKDKIKAIDPENSLLKQIDEAEKSESSGGKKSTQGKSRH